MFYYTTHSDMDARQYVHVDVSSDDIAQWMFYYIYHSEMDAPQYVHVDVYSHDFCQ
jgi:hypothetical protein